MLEDIDSKDPSVLRERDNLDEESPDVPDEVKRVDSPFVFVRKTSVLRLLTIVYRNFTFR